MREKVNPAVMTVIIIAVLAVVGFIGYKVLGSGGGKVDTNSMAQKYGMKDVPHSAMGQNTPMPGALGSRGPKPAGAAPSASGGAAGGQ